jgi:hypothetical protein
MHLRWRIHTATLNGCCVESFSEVSSVLV